MNDPRVERMAELIVGYSLAITPGQIFRIDGQQASAPLVVAMQRAGIAAGAHVYSKVEIEGTMELMLAEGSEEQIAFISDIDWREVDRLDAIATIWSETNTRSLTRADSGRHQRLISTQRKLSNRRWVRVAAGELKWCGTLMPTHSHAQEAEMSLREYEEFVFGACHVLDGEDPVAHWESVSEELNQRAAALADVRELRIVGPDTDLRVNVEGRRWTAADGHLNMPDGEVFTSPVETGTEGEIRFGFPALFHGREVEDVWLRFEGGRVVDFEASRGREYLAALLDMDAGARVLGEVAFGLNYEIDRFTRNILFDEKIGGTIHVALGAGFPQAGGKNRSGLHWDLICDLREEGEVYADGELVWKVGSFLREAEPAVEHV
jgi:aminopeptidase